MKKKGRRVLFCCLAVVFAVSTGALLLQLLDKAGGKSTYQDALKVATGETVSPQPSPASEPEEAAPLWIPEPVEGDPVMEEMAAISLTALRKENPDVVGWIRIPGTEVDYPLMQGTDNDYYLERTWDGQINSVGSIFLEYQNSPDFTDYNTIVYGHNMADGSMFGGLSRYFSEIYWEQHPYIYVTSDAGVYRYEVFSAYRAGLEDPTYGLSFRKTETRREFILHALENTEVLTKIIPGFQDRILTLSTCSGAGYSSRWVVHGRLKMVETGN